MATTPATGSTKPAATAPTPTPKSTTGSRSTVDIDGEITRLLDDSLNNVGTPDALITHLRDARTTLEPLDLNVDQATRATALANNWRDAVDSIINSRQSGDDVRLAVEDIKIHTQLVLTCDALETAVG